MNRQQRRAQARQARIENVPMDQIILPHQMSEAECEMMLLERLKMNLEQTGDPFHHRTQNGVVVTPDPTLLYYFSRLPSDKQDSIHKEWHKQIRQNKAKAIPCNRKFYGFDPYERN